MPGFSDFADFAGFAGVVEITGLNTSEFLYYLDELHGNKWTCIRIQFCLFSVSSNNTDVETTDGAVYPTAHKVCLWFFWFN